MLESLNKNFGLLIAFVLPGFIYLLGTIAIDNGGSIDWPHQVKSLNDLGGLLFFILAATAIGMVLSAIRWIVLDNVHHATGLTAPALDYRNLEIKQASFMLVVENNYRYYLFYGNTLMAMVLIGLSGFTNETGLSRLTLIRLLAICLVLFFASRDSLSRFYSRSRLIMGEAAPVRKFKNRKHC
ncbi:MAG: hypothetical protein ABL921_28455 [Pirellula sp.]